MASAPATAAGRYVVTFKPAVGEAAGFSVARETATLERRHSFQSDSRYRHAVKGFSAALTAAQVADLRRNPQLATITPDRVVYAAGRVPLQSGETVPTGIRRIAGVTAAGVHGASNAAVAVLDTGIDLGNVELNSRPGINCTGSGQPNDDNGHGTFVAGVIGAANSGSGLVGVAPGTALYAVKVLASDGSGLLSQVICGIDWVTANASALGIKVANLSFVGYGSPSTCQSDPLHAAICNSTDRGVVYTVAAGNGGLDFGGSPAGTPASFHEVLTVTAASDSDGQSGGQGGPPACDQTQGDDSFATFSNYATKPLDANHVVAAPGVCVASTALGGGSAVESGTSAAAPHAAGVAALCFGTAGTPGPCSEMTSREAIRQIRADAAARATAANGFNGDPNRPTGPYFGHLVSALDPSVRRIPPRPETPAAPVPAPPPAASSDTGVDLRLLRVARVQKVRRFRAIVMLGEEGKVSASAALKLSGRANGRRPRRTITFTPVSRPAKANSAVRLGLELRRRDLRTVRRALRRGKRLKAALTVAAEDQRGHSLLNHRRVVLRPG